MGIDVNQRQLIRVSSGRVDNIRVLCQITVNSPRKLEATIAQIHCDNEGKASYVCHPSRWGMIGDNASGTFENYATNIVITSNSHIMDVLIIWDVWLLDRCLSVWVIIGGASRRFAKRINLGFTKCRHFVGD